MRSFENFQVSIEAHQAWVTLNRPEQRNRMGRSFFRETGDIFEELDRNEAVRVVVVSASGKTFSAGLDLQEAAAIMGDGSALAREQTREMILEGQRGFSRIERCRKPVIAAVHGHCIGGGVDLIAACDMRLASREAVFSIRETRIGFIADLGTLQRLPRIVGEGWFRELALTGRDFTAGEALRMGLITRICEDPGALLAEARSLAAQVAANPPLAVQGVKDVILFSRDHGTEASLHYVAQKNAAALPSEDLLEAIAAFMEKRAPVFKGR
jgi:enoyl-CoA hydratase